VLAELVDQGYFDLNLALEVARRILYANAIDFWRLPKLDFVQKWEEQRR
jgi:hypothetical protein